MNHSRKKVGGRPLRRKDIYDIGVWSRPLPMIILRSPKGWTAPREIDGHYLEGFWRARQIPIADIATNPSHLKLLEAWMRSYGASAQPADKSKNHTHQFGIDPKDITDWQWPF